MKRSALSLLVGPLLFLSCGSQDSVETQSHSEARPPRSLLLVTIDTLRADHLGCYGYKLASTPALDALAAGGVRFTEASSTAPLTFPSHTSIMTGTIPPFHGARDNGSHRALPELVTMAEIFQGAGFQTGAFTAAFVLDSIYGLDQGFDVYSDTPQLEEKPTAEFEERSARDVNSDAVAWLETLDPSKPYFMWVHYFEPHQPYPPLETIPAQYRNRAYDWEVHTADNELGMLLANLERLGRRDETLVVVTSDHGESFGEHGENTHGYFAYQAVLHVPLILQHASLPAGNVVTERVSSTHILPTLLELFDLAPGDIPSLGGSLVPLMNGQASEVLTVYFESMTPRLNYGWAPIQGVTVEDTKYIHVPRPELYKLDEDPREEHNLHRAKSQESAELEAELQRVLSENFVPERIAAARRILTADEREKLANLGYVGTASDTTPELTLADPKDGIERILREDQMRGHLERGENEQAEAILRDLLREDPKNPIFNAHYGLLMMKLKRHADAVPYLRHSIAGGQDNATVYSNLGTCLNFTGDYAESKAAFAEALKQNPQHLLTLFWMGQTCAKLGHKQDAIRAYEGLLEHWDGDEGPTTRQVRSLLADLKR